MTLERRTPTGPLADFEERRAQQRWEASISPHDGWFFKWFVTYSCGMLSYENDGNFRRTLKGAQRKAERVIAKRNAKIEDEQRRGTWKVT